MRYFALVLLFTSLSTWGQESVPRLNTSINGIDIGGIEYWPFDDTIESSPYPNRVLWSFEEGSPLAQKCALDSSRRLTTWLEDTESEVYGKLKELKRRGGPSQFWMWTNDYTKAPSQAARGMRPSRVWHWCAQAGDMIENPDCGWLKFESAVGPDGVCKMPEAAQVANFLQQKIDSLEEPLQPERTESAINEFNGGRGYQSTDRVNSPSTAPAAGATGNR